MEEGIELRVEVRSILHYPGARRIGCFPDHSRRLCGPERSVIRPSERASSGNLRHFFEPARTITAGSSSAARLWVTRPYPGLKKQRAAEFVNLLELARADRLWPRPRDHSDPVGQVGRPDPHGAIEGSENGDIANIDNCRMSVSVLGHLSRFAMSPFPIPRGGAVSRPATRSFARSRATKSLGSYDQLMNRIIEMRQEGRTIKQIAVQLNAEGYRTPRSRKGYTSAVGAKAVVSWRTDPGKDWDKATRSPRVVAAGPGSLASNVGEQAQGLGRARQGSLAAGSAARPVGCLGRCAGTTAVEESPCGLEARQGCRRRHVTRSDHQLIIFNLIDPPRSNGGSRDCDKGGVMRRRSGSVGALGGNPQSDPARIRLAFVREVPFVSGRVS